jgi:hypothetical protein
MRDAESLVQIEVAHIGANVTWPCQSNERVHVRAVETILRTKVPWVNSPDVRFGSLADTRGRVCPLHPSRADMLSAAIDVC